MNPTWNSGQIDWSQITPLGGTNLVQVYTAAPQGGGAYLYWWRPELESETFRQALQQFAQQFPFGDLCCNVASVVAQEWANTISPYVIQSCTFTATPEGAYLPEVD
jgi:hypothetical protein